MQAVGEYLHQLRTARDLSQAEAAAQIGIAAKTVERWEKGGNEPKLSLLRAYVSALHGSFDYAMRLWLSTGEEPDMQALAGLSPEQVRWWLDRSPERRAQLVEALRHLYDADQQ